MKNFLVGLTEKGKKRPVINGYESETGTGKSIKEWLENKGHTVHWITTYKGKEPKMKEYFAEYVEGDNTFVLTATAYCKDHLIFDVELEGSKKVRKVVSATNHHICQYCGGIAKGPDKDVLCEDCRMTFGHAFYSEL